MSGFIEQVELDSGRMDIYKSVPVGEGPFPSLVVIMNAFGVAEFTKGMCDRFADEGFLAVAPDLFHSISDQMADSQGKTKRELLDDTQIPMMFHFGENDDNPSQSDMLILDKELTRLRKDYRFYCYPDAGHAFMDFGDRVRYNQRASEMSWPRTMDFLNEHLNN